MPWNIGGKAQSKNSFKFQNETHLVDIFIAKKEYFEGIPNFLINE